MQTAGYLPKLHIVLTSILLMEYWFEFVCIKFPSQPLHNYIIYIATIAVLWYNSVVPTFIHLRMQQIFVLLYIRVFNCIFNTAHSLYCYEYNNVAPNFNQSVHACDDVCID